MSNSHCDFVSVDLLENIADELKLSKKEIANFCGASRQQVLNWKKKGRMPAIRFAAVENALRKAEENRHIEAIKKINKLFER
jgi:hypothetical protein